MKKHLLNTLALLPLFLVAQPNTDVFLFDLNTENGTFELSNMKNISDNEGYDNQPSFLDNNTRTCNCQCRIDFIRRIAQWSDRYCKI